MKRIFHLLVFQQKRKTSKTKLLNYYFWFVNIQKILKNQLISFEIEFHNFVILLSFILISLNILNLVFNPLTFNWQTRRLAKLNGNIYFKNIGNQLVTEYQQYSETLANLTKKEPAWRLKESQLIQFGILSSNRSTNTFVVINYNRLNDLPIRIYYSDEKILNFSHTFTKNIFINQYLPTTIASTGHLILSHDLIFKYQPWLVNAKTKEFLYINQPFLRLDSSLKSFVSSEDIILPKLTPPFAEGYQFYNGLPKLKYSLFLANNLKQQSISLWTLPPLNFLSQLNIGFDYFPEDLQSLKDYLTFSEWCSNNNEYLYPYLSSRCTSLYMKTEKASFLINSDLPNTYLSNQMTKNSLRHYLKSPNLFDLTKNFHEPSQQNDLYLSIKPFVETREPLGIQSFLSIIQLGFLLFFYRVFQTVYKDFGKEILSIFIDFIKIIGIIDDEEWVKEDLNLAKQRKSFRSIKKIKTRLRNIAGVERSILEIGEIIWICRSAKQNIFGERLLNFNFLKNQLSYPNLRKAMQDIASTMFINSKAFLFIGPPGTGKTLLVQAIAGESEVPILVQSGSILKNPRQRGKGARMIQKLFQRARQIAPCIIFIDEVDGLGARRSHMSLNVTGNYDLLELIDNHSFPFFSGFENIYPKAIETPDELETYENLDMLADPQEKISLQVLQENEFENISRTEQVSLLTQLLIELDGLKPLNHIIVIGATNRFGILDPALLRPGRFNQFLNLSLPDEWKRIDLFKLYSRQLGFEKEVVWSYFSRRTEGLSSADIAAIVNESAIRAISENKKHNIQSLEIGIDRITTTPSRQSYVNVSHENKRFVSGYWDFYQIYESATAFCFPSLLFFNLTAHKNLQLQLQNAYYSISKSIFSVLFKHTPEMSIISFFTRKPNFRYNSANSLVNLLENKFIYRMEVETKLVYFLSGKSAELLSNSIPLISKRKYSFPSHLKLIYQLYEQSSFGSQDLKQATLLSKLMIHKWYFYAEQIVTEKYHWISRNTNQHELDVEEIRLFKAIAEEMQSQMDQQNLFVNRAQKWSFRTWWSQLIQKKFNFVDHSVLNWYRIYLADPEESEQNIEWVPPDDFYLTENISQMNLSSFWNNFLLYTQDYLYHSLVLNAFNLSFKTIKNFRELLDLLADFLMRFLKIQEEFIIVKVKIFLQYQQKKVKIEADEILLNWNYHGSHIKNGKQTILIHTWGKYSRRKKSKKLWIKKLKQIEKEITDSNLND
uniref:Cell division protein FTSH n=1 Tax=Pseudoderbesia arbuscula TaxID=2320809 RepID=A0A386AYK0_9CHLO|nr:Cell division protein FTSH [Pseudoderbesia arbuscula]